MARLGAAFAVDTASGDDRHISSVLDVEIIVHHIDAFLAHNDRDVHLLVFCLTADMDIDSRLILFLHNMDMAAVAVADGHAVQPQVVCAFLFKPVGVDHFQHIFCHFVELRCLITLHRAHLPFVSCTRRNPVPRRTVSA